MRTRTNFVWLKKSHKCVTVLLLKVILKPLREYAGLMLNNSLYTYLVKPPEFDRLLFIFRAFRDINYETLLKNRYDDDFTYELF